MGFCDVIEPWEGDVALLWDYVSSIVAVEDGLLARYSVELNLTLHEGEDIRVEIG